MGTLEKLGLAKMKKEKLILIALVCLAILAVYFQLLLRPLAMNLVNIMPKTSALRQDLLNAKSKIAKMDTTEKESRKLRLEMEKYSKIFPEKEEVPKLLEELSHMAIASNMKIIGIKPLSKGEATPAGKGFSYREIPIEIEARSGYHELGQFLQRLECGERFIMVKDLSVQSDNRSPKRHNVQLITSTYVLVKE